MRSAIDSFPKRLRNQPGSAALSTVIESIRNHPALQLEGDVLDRMITLSLLFTICFYRNLRCLGLHAYKELLANGMQVDTTEFGLVMKLVEGELTDTVRSGKRPSGPHYVLMLEAAKAAGINTSPVERFVDLLNEGEEVDLACEAVGFNTAITDYFSYSDVCCHNYLSSLATIAGREHVLAFTFEVMLAALDGIASKSQRRRLKLFRRFLKLHVNLDRDQAKEPHEQLMGYLLKGLTDQQLEEVVAVMTTFFARRLAVYDICLTSGAIL
jgi:hypothetical protein